MGEVMQEKTKIDYAEYYTGDVFKSYNDTHDIKAKSKPVDDTVRPNVAKSASPTTTYEKNIKMDKPVEVIDASSADGSNVIKSAKPMQTTGTSYTPDESKDRYAALAIVSCVLGCIGICTGVFTIMVQNILAVVFGIIYMAKPNNNKHTSVPAIIGIVTGIFGICFWILMIIIVELE